MIFDGAPTDSEIRGDILAGMAGKNHFQYLSLPEGEASEVLGGVFTPFRELGGVTA